PPRHPNDNIFAHGVGWHILWVGFLMGVVTLGMQWWSIHHSNSHWQTMTFTVLCFSQLGHVLAIRSNRLSLFKQGLCSNTPMLIALVVTVGLQLLVIYLPFFNEVFKTQPLPAEELLIVVATSSIVFWAVEIEKLIRR